MAARTAWNLGGFIQSQLVLTVGFEQVLCSHDGEGAHKTRDQQRSGGFCAGGRCARPSQCSIASTLP